MKRTKICEWVDTYPGRVGPDCYPTQRGTPKHAPLRHYRGPSHFTKATTPYKPVARFKGGSSLDDDPRPTKAQKKAARRQSEIAARVTR